MNLQKTVAIAVMLVISVTTSCSKSTVEPASSTGAIKANTAVENFTGRPFERHTLNASGFHFMNEFIRPEVRSRIDEEPIGDTDSAFEPAAIDPGAGADQTQTETGEGQPAEEQPAPVTGDESASTDSVRFGWARKAFGDAVKSNAGATGVIILYADDNYYDINSVMAFVEDGRNRIAERSAIGAERIQVVYGGYRGVPQVELWVVPEGSMPELKPDDRSQPNQPEN